MPTIPAAGREYVRAYLTAAPDDARLEVTLDGGATWHPTTRDGDVVTFLVAGPDAAPHDDALVLPLGRTRVHVRAVDNPEVVIRLAGALDVG